MRLEPTSFICEPDPDNPGWLTWDVADKARFNAAAMGKLLVRQEGDNVCRLRMVPGVQHANLPGSVHGGVILALVDIALFATLWVRSRGDSSRAVTLEVHNQFIGAGELGQPLDAVTEVIKQTRRLAFMRGMIVQGDSLVAAFTGTMRTA
jgi:uncharacterized protein (TIGR00369 family)